MMWKKRVGHQENKNTKDSSFCDTGAVEIIDPTNDSSERSTVPVLKQVEAGPPQVNNKKGKSC